MVRTLVAASSPWPSTRHPAAHRASVQRSRPFSEVEALLKGRGPSQEVEALLKRLRPFSEVEALLKG